MSTGVTSKLRALSDGAAGRIAAKVWWVIVFGTIVVMAVLAVDRLLFYIRDRAGWICSPSPQAEPQATVKFNTAEPCYPMGITTVAGTTYRFDVEVTSDWRDGRLKAGPNGLIEDPPLRMALFAPSRRHVSRPWFELTGRIGKRGGEMFPIGSGTCYTAKSSAPIYLYVNDAVSGFMPGKRWAFAYRWSIGPNTGTANVSVEEVEHSPKCGELNSCIGCFGRF